MGESAADIFSEGRGFMAAFDLTMQLQVGCPGGCLFCYVPSQPMLAPPPVKGPQGRKWGFEVRNKINVSKKIRRHIEKGKLSDKTIYWSGVTDPYAAPPQMTREVWQILCETPNHLRPRRLVIQTRFHPERDVELMMDYYHNTQTSDNEPPIVISFSIGTDRNDFIRSWERATPLFEQRIKSIENLRKSGIFVVATLSPFGIWNDLPGTLKMFKSFGIPYITSLFFKEKTKFANTSGLFLDYIHKEYPFLLDQAWQNCMFEEMKEVYGEDRVLIGQEGFNSLIRPHKVGN